MNQAVEYLDIDSPLHRLNPLTKLTGLLCIFTLGIIFSSPLILTLIIGIIYLLYIVAKASHIFKAYFKPLFTMGLFMLVLQVLFAHDGPELVRYIPRHIPVLGWIGSINEGSLNLGLAMMTRMTLFGLALPLLLAVTQPRDLVLVLVEKLKFPYQYAFMFITALRFIPTLFVEVNQVIQAQKARAFELNTKNPVKKVKAYLPLVTPLVMISLKKAERLAIAMETRGYGVGPRSYLRSPVFCKSDWMVCSGCTILVFMGIFFRIIGLGA